MSGEVNERGLLRRIASASEEHRNPWGARALALALAGGFCGLSIEAAASGHVAGSTTGTASLAHAALTFDVPAPAAPAALTAQAQRVLVWHGADVDGDGQEDFVNPTGEAPRACDDYGCGDFGARRDAGERRHEGVDYDAVAGQEIRSPISGYVTKIGMAYADDGRYRFVEVTNPALRYVTRVFYINPTVTEGQAVRLGQVIGAQHSLQARYPGITNHVHVEIARVGGRRLAATTLISAKLETPDQAASDEQRLQLAEGGALRRG